MYMKKMMKKATQAIKNVGAFSAGMFVGTVYGSVVAAITSYAVLSTF